MWRFACAANLTQHGLFLATETVADWSCHCEQGTRLLARHSACFAEPPLVRPEAPGTPLVDPTLPMLPEEHTIHSDDDAESETFGEDDDDDFSLDAAMYMKHKPFTNVLEEEKLRERWDYAMEIQKVHEKSS